MGFSSEYSPKVANWLTECQAKLAKCKTPVQKLNEIISHIGSTIDSSVTLNEGLLQPEDVIEAGVGYCLEKSLVLCWASAILIPESYGEPIDLTQPVSGLMHHIARVVIDGQQYIADPEHLTVLTHPDTKVPIESLEEIDACPEVLFLLAGRFGPVVMRDSLSAFYLGKKSSSYAQRGSLALKAVLGDTAVSGPPTYSSLNQLLHLHKERLGSHRSKSSSYSIHTEPFDPYLKLDGVTDGHRLGALGWLIEEVFGETCRPQLKPIFKGKDYRYLILVPNPEDGYKRNYWVIDAASETLLDHPSREPISLHNLKAYPVVWASRESLGDLWMFTNQGPRNLNFQIGDVCNAKCTMCWQSWRRKHGEHRPTLPAEKIVSLINKHKDGLNSVELVSFGEPLLHPEINEILQGIGRTSEDRSIDRRIGINMVTNGSLTIPTELLQERGNLTFSIDAPTEKLYKTVRVGLAFDEVMANLFDAVNHPARNKERLIGINYVITKRNYHEISAMADLARELGVDYLAFLRGAALEKTDDAGQEILPEVDQELDLQVQETIEIAKTTIFSGIRSWFTPTLAERPNDSPMSAYPCPLPWTQLAIDTYGNAQPCCRAYELNLGPAETAWESQTLAELREGLLAHNLDPAQFSQCASCPHKW